MAMRFIDGFDHYTYSNTAKKKWDDGSAYETVAPGRFNVGNRCRPRGSGNIFVLTWVGMTKTIDSNGVSKIVTGAALRFDTGANDIEEGAFGHPFLALRGDDGKHQIQFFLERGTGRIRVGRANSSWPVGNSTTDTTSLAPTWYTDSDFVPPFGLWFYFETEVTAAGDLIVYADGETILNLTGETTLVGDATGYTGVRWMALTKFNAGYDIDDVYIADGTGSHVNSAIGEIRVEWRSTDGNGDTNSWIPSGTPNNFGNVDGATDFTETGEYNRTDVLGATDLYHHADFTRDGTIYGVQVNLGVRKDDVGNRKVKPLLRTGGTTFEGDEVKLFSDFVYVGHIWPQNPDTTDDWTRTEVNASQSGVIVST